VKGIEPGYEEKHFDAASKQGKLCLIASSDGREGSVLIHQDAFVYASILGGSDKVEYVLAPRRLAYVHVIRGGVTVNGIELQEGDALKVSEEQAIVIEKADAAEVLLFDLPY
jgi:redox-sensitive bicupin YhaK (pirin superfamily)